MKISQLIKNEQIINFMNSKIKYKNYKILYHVTKYKYAKNILENGFDISKSKNRAFGKGINLTDDILHLKHYINNEFNTIIICIVKYNKLKLNNPYYKNIDSIQSKKYIDKYGYSKPSYMYVPREYDGFYWKNIYVIKSKKLIYPLSLIKI